MKYAEVIVDISSPNLDRTFTYGIPEQLEEEIAPGTPVMIPFGRGNTLKKGYVVGISNKVQARGFEIKNIDSYVKQGLAIEDELMALAYRMKSFYGGMLKDSLATVIPVKKSVSRTRSEAGRKKEAFPEIAEILTQHPNGDGHRILLNPEQEAARKSFCDDFDNDIHKTYLLYGITGSGKTEVYIEMIRHCIEKGKEAIVLIPEISLTYQTVRRFALSFGEKVAFSHSKLSRGERYVQSEKAKNGEISIMIGPRSALFTPFKNLGLIIIDEEHEASYKSETTPKYHAREIAGWRAEMCGASLVLGSATPSIESYRRAMCGQYELLRLPARAGNAQLPKSHIVDMRLEMKKGNKSPFSNILSQKIEERLQKKEQIMLFINRRGYAGFLSCRSCGHVPKCPHCDISLTLHYDRRLYCHYCGYTSESTRTCPKCGSPFYAGFGTGTERIEEYITKKYPGARVLRMDADTTSKKGDFERILSSFRKEKADILIGTQMIVKGHDFPKVTLVGILAADMSMYASDYRAAERTYQLISQASGRAGRGELGGEVVIQTYNPEHYTIQTAAKNDYEGFYNQEILYRQICSYPPIGNMCVIFVQSKSSEINQRVCKSLSYAMDDYQCKTGEAFNVIGPAPASVKKVADVYRHLFYVKDRDYGRLVRLKDALELFVEKQNITDAIIQFDFNPMSSY